jgi:hypothetical protein
MSRRLFHAIVLVGTAMGCSSADTTGPSTQSDAKTEVASDGSSADTFPGIMPEPVDSSTDTFPTIAVDSTPADSDADTFPGIMPVMDSFPGIMPPPPPPPTPS